MDTVLSFAFIRYSARKIRKDIDGAQNSTMLNYIQGGHFSGKSGNGREFDSCQGSVGGKS